MCKKLSYNVVNVTLCSILTCAGIGSTWAISDEIEDALMLDAVAGSESTQASGSEADQPVISESVTSEVQEGAIQASEGVPAAPPAVQPSSPILTMEITPEAVLDSLQKKELALVQARKEIQILKKELQAQQEKGMMAVSAPADAVRTDTEDRLAASNAEVLRLKGLVQEILDANRRERAAMHYNMACTYRIAGQPEKAESEYLKALELNPQDAAIHYNLGVLYDEDLKRTADAKKYFLSFLELAPNDKDAALVLQWVKSME